MKKKEPGFVCFEKRLFLRHFPIRPAGLAAPEERESDRNFVNAVASVWRRCKRGRGQPAPPALCIYPKNRNTRKGGSAVKDFFSTAKFKILVALAVVLAGMMAWAGANNRLTSAPQELLGAAAVPFQKIGALLSEGVSGVVTKYAEYDSIVEENEQLKQENYDLRQQLVDYDKLKAENEAFRDLNNIREQNPEFEYASAFVIGRDPLDQFGGFTVDAGTLDNVKKGDVVVSDKGYLVGIVLEPGLTSSKVLTILSPSLNAAGVVSRTRDNGILTGDSAYSGDGLTTFTGLPRDTLATVGDEIITTGLGEVFPADILVGTVQELVPEASGKTTVAVVKPGEDILTLKHVQIIINR